MTESVDAQDSSYAAARLRLLNQE
ncbi:MAG: hypothetical protein QOF98_1545, partial [Streptomyces sp.]|nr:hypothetical protein [Streptomyces sp.]